MNKKVFNILSEIKSSKAEDGVIRITGMASTSDTDRIGDIIEPRAWKEGLKNFSKNPILLFNHDYNKPVGKVTDWSITDKGLEITGEISKAAKKLYKLIEDGVLRTFSVGFIIEDAVYNEKTGGLNITKAELLEVSVVSIPMNQDATFSVAKSFSSDLEAKDYISNFKSSKTTGPNQVDDVNASNPEEPPVEAAKSAKKEPIKMDVKEIQAMVEKAATEAAKLATAKVEMQAAEKAAKEKAEAEKNDIQQKLNSLEAGKTGAEKLAEEFKSQLANKDAEMAETIAKFKKDLEDNAKEMEDMRKSRGFFADRGTTGNSIKTYGDELVQAHLLGIITGKGWNTDFAKEVAQKAGIDYLAQAPDLDQEIQDRILKEVTVFTRVKDLFREVTVNGAATVMPFQSDVGLAAWAQDAPSGNLENRPQATANQYEAKQVILNAYRLISSTFIKNDTDEQVLVNLMPMMVEGVARAHARAVESQLLNGNTNPFDGLVTLAAASPSLTPPVAAGTLTGLQLLQMRGEMGKFGLVPEEVAFLVNLAEYYSLLEDGAFANLNEVGEMATKIKGIVGAVYGSPVIVSDEFPAVATGAFAACAVNTRNYLVPRLRGVRVEQDYEVMNQRRIIVASQSLGFTEIQAGAGVIQPAVKLSYGTIA